MTTVGIGNGVRAERGLQWDAAVHPTRHADFRDSIQFHANPPAPLNSSKVSACRRSSRYRISELGQGRKTPTSKPGCRMQLGKERSGAAPGPPPGPDVGRNGPLPLGSGSPAA